MKNLQSLLPICAGYLDTALLQILRRLLSSGLAYLDPVIDFLGSGAFRHARGGSFALRHTRAAFKRGDPAPHFHSKVVFAGFRTGKAALDLRFDLSIGLCSARRGFACRSRSSGF